MMRIVHALIAAATFAYAGLAGAQAWPSKPTRVIVPVPSGTSPDVIGRLFSERLGRAFGQAFIVENITGAGGLIASRTVAKADSDGHTLYFAGTGALITDPHMVKDLGYDPERDFAFISMIYSEGSLAVAVHPDVTAKTLPEFIAMAKKKPGSISYGTTNVALTILFGRWLQKLTDTEMVAVAYKSQGQQIQDVLAGRTQMVIVSPPNVDAFLKAGRLRLIAIDGLKPHPLAPAVETIDKTLPGFHMSGLGILAAPAGIATSTMQRINAEMEKIVRSPDYIQSLLTMGFTVEGAGTPQSILAFLRERRAYWDKVMKGLNVQPE